MPQLRRDPVSGRWVIIATERAARPRDFQTKAREVRGGFCPFCEGNEDKTPPEVAACRDADSKPDGPGWRVRVVPNKYPALNLEGNPEEHDAGLYCAMNGVGRHEVFIESPRHAVSPTEQPPDLLADALCVQRQRLLELKKDKRLIYACLFKNVGTTAGASLEHTHSQLICTPVAPKPVQEEMRLCEDFWDANGRCLVCSILAQELTDGSRIVMDSEQYVVFTPFASRFPFEMWILPKEHISHFEDTSPEALRELARVVHDALRRLDLALDEPPYNYIVHTATFDLGPLDFFHWHIEIIPRVTRVAGFEWGTGFYINPMLPEKAAQYLREALPERVTAGA